MATNWCWDSSSGASIGPGLYFAWLVYGGKGWLSTPEKSFQVQSNHFYLMPASENVYRGHHDPSQPLHLSWLIFRDNIAECLNWEGSSPVVHSVANPSFATGLIQRLLDAERTLQSLWLRAFLAEVFEPSAGSTVHSETWIIELGQTIREHPEAFNELSDMMKGKKISKDHFIRKFKSLHGSTPIDHLIRAKIDLAQRKLLMSQQSIKSIATELGYVDMFCFSRQFKKRTGQSPTQFRRKG